MKPLPSVGDRFGRYVVTASGLRKGKVLAVAAAHSGSAPLLAVALAAAWAHALDLRRHVIGCGWAAGERAP